MSDSAGLFESVKERIRDAVDIVDLVGQYIPLQRQGSSYVGRCPWHDDSRPSLQINPQRQTFKCWVCDIGGDIFSFVMKVENVDFREALEILSEKTGIALPQRNSDKKQPVQDGGITKKDLHKAADFLAKLYHQTLQSSPEAEIARTYCRERKLDTEAVEKFRIGYAPLDTGFLTQKWKNVPNGLQILEAVGNRKNGRDFFGGRLIFPICDERGQTVAFGGRLIPNSPLSRDDWHKDRKYLNSSETSIFSKHRVLYGLDIAKNVIKKTGRALIMEGYTDCITAHQFGFGDAVAVLGTALGQEHIKLLKRMGAEKIVLMLDGDAAGQSRAESDNVLSDFIAQGADMSVVILPENLDPCEYLEKYGAEALEAYLKTQQVNALEHLFKIKTRNIDLQNDIAAAGKALDSMLRIIAHSPAKTAPNDPVVFRVETTLQKLAVRFNQPLEQVKRRLNEQRILIERQNERRVRTSDSNQFNESSGQIQAPTEHFQQFADTQTSDDELILPDPLEREMLELWIADSTAFYDFWEKVTADRYLSPLTKAVYEKCCDLMNHDKTPTLKHLLVAFDDPMMKAFLVELAESGDKKIFNKDIDNDFRLAQTTAPTEMETEEIEAVTKTLEKELAHRQIEPERRTKLITGLLAAFDRRAEEQERLTQINSLKDQSLSNEDAIEQLLKLQKGMLKRRKEP